MRLQWMQHMAQEHHLVSLGQQATLLSPVYCCGHLLNGHHGKRHSGTMAELTALTVQALLCCTRIARAANPAHPLRWQKQTVTELTRCASAAIKGKLYHLTTSRSAAVPWENRQHVTCTASKQYLVCARCRQAGANCYVAAQPVRGYGEVTCRERQITALLLELRSDQQ
jgi:hypothetical protein